MTTGDRPESVFPERTVVTLPDTARRAVITGIGVVAPNGARHGVLVEGDQEGRRAGSADRRASIPSQYDTQIAGEVDGFEPENYIEKRLMVQTDRWTWMALAATQMAFDDAKFDPDEHDPWTDERDHGLELGRQRVRPEGDPGAVGEGPGLRGRLPVDRVVLRGHHRPDLDQARHEGHLRRRSCPRAPAGSRRSSTRAGCMRRGMRARRERRLRGPDRPVRADLPDAQRLPEPASSDPAAAYRPFDARANGYVPGEGGAILHARDAGAAPRSGARRRSTARSPATARRTTPTTSASPRRTAASTPARCASRSRTPASGPDDVDVVFADGAGVPEADAIEAAAIKDVFGKRGTEVPVTVPKTMVGRLYAGGASLDVATALHVDARRRDPADDQPRRAGRGLRPELRHRLGPEGRPRHRARGRARLRRLQRRARPARAG